MGSTKATTSYFEVATNSGLEQTAAGGVCNLHTLQNARQNDCACIWHVHTDEARWLALLLWASEGSRLARHHPHSLAWGLTCWVIQVERSTSLAGEIGWGVAHECGCYVLLCINVTGIQLRFE